MIADSVIHNIAFHVERKLIEVSLRQNTQGRYLRITESLSNHRDAIILPSAGLSQLRDALSEMVARDEAAG